MLSLNLKCASAKYQASILVTSFHERDKSKLRFSNDRLPLILAATLALGMFLGQKLPHYDKHFQLGATGAGSTFDENHARL